MEEEETIINEEYEAQFYSYLPSDIVEGVKELTREHFMDTINKLKIEMSKISTDVLPEEELNEGIMKLRKITNENIDKTFPKLSQHLVNKIMKIPSYVLLPEDAEQASGVSHEEYESLKEKIKDLHVQIKNEKYAEAVLKEELKRIEVVAESQRKLLESSFCSSVADLEDDQEKLSFLTEISEERRQSLKNLELLGEEVNWRGSLGEMLEYDILQ